MSISAVKKHGSRKRISSFSHKLKRIRQQEIFKNQQKRKFESLTPREVEILRLIVRDYNNPGIACKLSISRFTVEQHRKHINRKLKTNSFGSLFQYALAFDLV